MVAMAWQLYKNNRGDCCCHCRNHQLACLVALLFLAVAPGSSSSPQALTTSATNVYEILARPQALAAALATSSSAALHITPYALPHDTHIRARLLPLERVRTCNGLGAMLQYYLESSARMPMLMYTQDMVCVVMVPCAHLTGCDTRENMWFIPIMHNVHNVGSSVFIMIPSHGPAGITLLADPTTPCAGLLSNSTHTPTLTPESAHIPLTVDVFTSTFGVLLDPIHALDGQYWRVYRIDVQGGVRDDGFVAGGGGVYSGIYNTGPSPFVLINASDVSVGGVDAPVVLTMITPQVCRC